MRHILLLIAIVAGLAAPVSAADDASNARAVISSQVEALTRDEADKAYGFAAPGIQRMFTDPDRFMAMVRNAYAPIYRHRSFEFAEATSADGKIEQKARIIDNEGVPWDALYTLETQPDGSLKIIGCMLLKVGQSV